MPLPKRRVVKVAGYCALCRAKEIALYGTLLKPGKKHNATCKDAGCKHPAEYTVR